MAQRAVYVGMGAPDSSGAPRSFICRRWLASPMTKARAPRDRAHVCSSPSQSRRGFTLSLLCLFSVPYIFVYVCFLSLHTRASTTCAIWPFPWPLLIHALGSIRLHPLSLVCSCRLNIRDHCGYVLAACRRPCRALLYVCPRCTVQTSIDSIYIPATATPPPPPSQVCPAALSDNGNVSWVVFQGHCGWSLKLTVNLYLMRQQWDVVDSLQDTCIVHFVPTTNSV